LRENATEDELVADPVEIAPRLLQDTVHVHLVTLSDPGRQVDTRVLHVS
jgi:hypothetical protein